LGDQALLAEQRANVRLSQDFVERCVVAIDDLFRRIGRSQNAVPEIDIEIGDAEFGERQHVRRLRRPLLAADGEDADLSGFHQRKRGVDRQKHRRDVAAREILYRAGRA
jgi:hypothetical protein